MTATIVTQNAPQSAGKRKPALSEGKRAERRLGLLLIAPAVVLMIVVTGYPIVYAFWLSLQKASLSAPGQDEFIGFSNYATVLSDSYWWTAFSVLTPRGTMRSLRPLPKTLISRPSRSMSPIFRLRSSLRRSMPSQNNNMTSLFLIPS